MTRRENDEKDVSKGVKEVTLDGVRRPSYVRCIEGMELGAHLFKNYDPIGEFGEVSS